MLGWKVIITEATPTPSGNTLASWCTETGGIDWINSLVEQGLVQVKNLNAGYPNSYIATAKELLPIMIAELIPSSATKKWDVKLLDADLRQYTADQIFNIEVWDLS